MKKWKLYESKSQQYLSSTVNIPNIKFKENGGSDSNSNDIHVNFKEETLFSVEAKLSPSQCGQFVLVRDKSNKLVLSENMRFENRYTNQIINLIDTNYENEIPLLELDLPQSLMSGWVKEHYKNKGVAFFITSTSLDSFNSIIPIADIEKYFQFTAVLRRKRSGTRKVPKKDIDASKLLLLNHLSSNNLNNYNIIEEAGSIIFDIEGNYVFESNNLYFDKYYISKIEESRYKVKVRATTNNLNVIFSLVYIGAKLNSGLDKLTNTIKNKIKQLH